MSATAAAPERKDTKKSKRKAPIATPSGSTQKIKKAKPAQYKYSDEPDKPLSAYNIFFRDKRVSAAECAMLWKTISSEENSRFAAEAHAEKLQYNTQMTAWNAKFETRRHALVLGQAEYTRFAPLPLVANDIAMVSGLLQRMGWYVVSRSVLESGDDISKVIEHFIEGTHQPGKEATSVLIYYSGHGSSRLHKTTKQPLSILYGRNDESPYELDTDAIRKKIDARDGSVRSVTLGFILDACRDHMPAKPGAPVSLQQIALPSVSNGFIGYACKPNSSASAGSVQYSLYTASLVKHLDKEIDVNSLLRLVCGEVYAASQKKFEPWYSESIKIPFYSLHPVAVANCAGAEAPTAVLTHGSSQ
jgi:hypothetical protein